MRKARRRRSHDQSTAKATPIPHRPPPFLFSLHPHPQKKPRPCILDEYVKDRSAAPAGPREKYAAADDSLLIEDDGARMRLVLAPDAAVGALPIAQVGQ